MRTQISLFIALLLMLFQLPSALANTQLQTSVSSNQVFLGDLFVLTIELNDTGSEYKLDTRPLEQEFTVYRPSESRSTQIINGNAQRQTVWQINLQAKRIGELTIPAINIGSLKTKPIQISVKKPSEEATKLADNAVFMENSITKKSVYIDQPLRLTTTIYLAQNSRDLELNPPQLNGAKISVYGEDKNSITIRHGMRYQVITRQYQIEPTEVGTFTISSPLLTGNLRKLEQISDWQNRIVSEPINIRGDSLTIQVKAQPQNYQGKWLISEDVRLIENEQLTEKSYHVGEPITRKVTLQVAGINSEKVSDIDFNYPANLRYYPDKDNLQEENINGLIYASRIMTHAIIADKAGQLTLPEIKLAWWNSITDKQEFAVLPAQTVTILANDSNTQTIVQQTAPPLQEEQAKQPVNNIIVNSNELIYWQITTAILLFALLVMIIYHLYIRKQLTNGASQKAEQSVSENKQAYLTLQQALKQGNARQTYQALLHYWQGELPQLKSLKQLGDQLKWQKQMTMELSEEIKQLEEACANQSNLWQSEKLGVLLTKYNEFKNKRSDKDDTEIMDINDNNY
ncbi:BatD family protein [Psychromonas sp. MME2]|uniref:BatD family protein n=1 Tax=unclassified Psychromonas TaxID=2614957 RepID=UPI00339CEA2E